MRSHAITASLDIVVANVHLEHVLKPISLLIRDESTGELEHREVVGREALPAHEQPPKAVVPTVGSFDDPASWRPPHAAQEGGLAASSDVRDDPPTASSTSATIHLSCTLAPVIRTANGPPRPSVRTWRFTPSFARSVGFGPVAPPLWAPWPWRCRRPRSPT